MPILATAMEEMVVDAMLARHRGPSPRTDPCRAFRLAVRLKLPSAVPLSLSTTLPKRGGEQSMVSVGSCTTCQHSIGISTRFSQTSAPAQPAQHQ